jgi:hypothetical protein
MDWVLLKSSTVYQHGRLTRDLTNGKTIETHFCPDDESQWRVDWISIVGRVDWISIAGRVGNHRVLASCN